MRHIANYAIATALGVLLAAQAALAGPSSTSVTYGPASATRPGIVSTGAQTFAGPKVFTSTISAGGMVRAEGYSPFAAGIGAEMYYAGGTATFQGRNGGSGAIIPTVLDGNGTYIRNNGVNRMVTDASGSTFSGMVTLTGGLGTGVRVCLTTPVTAAAASDHVIVTKLSTPGPVAVSLPAGVAGQTFVIQDGTGDAASNNITITPAAGTINGAGTKTISTNYGRTTLYYDGTQWLSN